MRGLIIITGVLQAAAIVLLLYLLAGDRASRPSPERVPSATSAHTADAYPLDEARLRRIIRDELAHLTGAPGPHDVAGAPARQPRDPVADRDQRLVVEQQLAYFRSLGEVKPDEMASLHVEIAKLAPRDRTEMLRALARALNSGEIKGFP